MKRRRGIAEGKIGQGGIVHSTFWRALGAVFLVMVVTGPAYSADKVGLRYGFVATGINAQWVYGRDLGIFAQEGIDLELREGKGSAVTAQTVAAGTDDFGTDVDGGTFLGLAAKGLPATAVLANTSKNPLAIISAEKSPLNTPRDMIGKQIGITLGAATGVLLPVFLERNDLKADQVNTVNMQPAALLSALLSGRLDGVATYATVGAALEQKGLKTHAMMFSDHKMVLPPPYVIVSNSLLHNNPDLVRRFVKASRKALLATIRNPNAAIAAFAKAYPTYGAETAAAELRVFIRLGWPQARTDEDVGQLSLADAKAGVVVLAQAGLLPLDTDPAKYISGGR